MPPTNVSAPKSNSKSRRCIIEGNRVILNALWALLITADEKYMEFLFYEILAYIGNTILWSHPEGCNIVMGSQVRTIIPVWNINDEEIEKYIDLVNQIKDGKVKNGENEENKDEENKDEENEDGENEDGDGDEDEEDGDEEDGEQENEEGDEQDDNENPNKDVFSMDDVGEYGRMKKIRQNRTPDFKWFYIVSGTDGPSMEILAFWEAKLKSDALDQMSIQASFILKKWDRQFIWGLEVKIKENQIYLCSHKFTRKNTKKLPAYALSKENEEREEYTEQSGRRRSGKKRGEWFPMFDVSGNEILDYSKPFMDAIDNIMKDNHLEAVDWHSRPKTAWSEMEVTKTGENVTKRQKVKK